MKKILGITFGGLQKKAIMLVVIMLSAATILFVGVSLYQSRMLTDVVENTRVEQQNAISKTSEETMHSMLEETLVQNTELLANLADNDFAEVVDYVYMLQTMAQDLFENKDTVVPAECSLPDPNLDGTPNAHVLCEEGVDYTQSEYLGIAANMSSAMIAMFSNSDKIESCYIGLADGTHIGVDCNTMDKLDKNLDPIPFPVRKRPWYVGAIEAGGLYFTGIEKDAYTGNYLITCSAPIVANGTNYGVVGIDIVLSNVDDVISSSKDDDGYVYIVNDDGQVILAPDDNGVFKAEISAKAEDLRNSENQVLAQFIKNSLEGATDLTEVTINDRQYYMAGAPMATIGWAVISVVDKEITEQPEKLMLAEYDSINEKAMAAFREGSSGTMRIILLLLAVIFAAGLGAALFAAGRMVKPIEAMTKDIMKSSHTGHLFEMKDCYRTNDEIEMLAESFEDLSKKTKRYIKEITEITKEKERVNTELHMASQIQSSMLPHIFPPFPERSEFDLYASMDPAKEVGGDFYDFFLIDDDHLCMVMADVSGKGVPAALFMMISKVILQSCAMLGQSPAEILTKTNEALCSNNQVEMFVTVWIGIMEISTGKITAANAGHEYPVLKRDGKFSLLKDKHGFVIGGMDGMKYKEYEIQLEKGDMLFLYTDGVPEATDAESKMFGTGQMLDVLNEEPDVTPEKILKNMRSAVDGFVKDAEQFDDLTMLCMEYRGTDENS